MPGLDDVACRDVQGFSYYHRYARARVTAITIQRVTIPASLSGGADSKAPHGRADTGVGSARQSLHSALSGTNVSGVAAIADGSPGMSGSQFAQSWTCRRGKLIA